jgi:hypothetical protein
MLPKRHGGIGTGYSKILAVDAGNCSDVYQVVDFARQYGLEIKRVLKNISVSRVFTIYQLANLVINELPRIIQPENNMIVIYGLLHLFVSDPLLLGRMRSRLIKNKPPIMIYWMHSGYHYSSIGGKIQAQYHTLKNKTFKAHFALPTQEPTFSTNIGTDKKALLLCFLECGADNSY